MRILLIGGAGFIGSQTALRLLELGHEPLVLDLLDPQIHGDEPLKSPTCSLLAGRVEIRQGDTRDREAVEQAMRGVEAVYYLPAGTGTGQSMYQVERYCDINVRGAAVFCEALAAGGHDVSAVVVSSSRAVYGEGAAHCVKHGRIFPRPRRIRDLEAGAFELECPACGAEVVPASSSEEDACPPVSIYGITKLAQEQVIQKTAETLGIGCTAFRYQNVYGPGQSLKNPYTGILSIFTQLAMEGREIPLFEDALATRDFVHVADVVEFNVRALGDGAGGSRILNIGSGVRSTLVDLAGAVAAGLGQEPNFRVTGQFRLGDIRHAAADISALHAALGGHRFVPLAEGVRMFVEWVVREGAGAGANRRFDDSLREMMAAGLLRKAKKP